MPASRSGLLDVLNPATGQLIAQIAHATDADVDRAVSSARTAFESDDWRRCRTARARG